MFTFVSARACALILLLTVCGAALTGCGYSAQQLSLDKDQARQSLNTALQAWQEGKKPTDLKPGIIVGDQDWDDGVGLAGFKVLPDETDDGTNLHIPVELTLKPQSGAEKKTSVTYTVGTSPVITVIRE